MRAAPRWPLHPQPQDGEFLSSWLNRVAAVYGMEGHELLNDDLGFHNEDLIDFAAPQGLLPLLAERSRVPMDTLRAMSFSGWTP